MAEVATYSKPHEIRTEDNQHMICRGKEIRSVYTEQFDSQALSFEKSNDPQELLEREYMQHG